MRHRLYYSIAILSATAFFRALLPAQAPAPQAPAPAQPSSQAQLAAPAPAAKVSAADLALTNAALNDVVDRLARMLHIVLVLPKEGLAGSISINSYGETRDLDARNLLDMILRINGYAMQQEGEEYRVFKMTDAMSQPIPITVNGRDIPEDDRIVLNMIFLKYVSVTELTKVLNEFKGENARIITYEPANLLFILDNGRSLHRLRDIISQFDSDTFNKQRVHIYELEEARPSDVEKELDTILKGISLDSKNSTVHFLAIDSLNLLIAVAPNAGVFETVEDWIKKLDIPAKPPAGAVDDYVYTVLYGRNDCLAFALNQLFNPASASMPMSMMGGTQGGAYNNYGYGAGGSGAYAGAFGGGGGYGGGGYGGSSGGYGAGAYGGMGGVGGGYGSPNSFTSGFGGSGGCSGMGGFGGAGMGGSGYGAPAFGGYSALTPLATTQGGQPQAQQQTATGNSNVAVVQAPAATVQQEAPPRIVSLPFDNKLMIYADPQKLQTILKMLKELDRPPRQILLDAKIYSVDLTDNFASGIAAYFGNAAGNTSGLTLAPPALSLIGGTSTLTAGMLVSKTRQLLGALSLNENIGHVHVLSEPSLIATDSIPAAINVGTQVPVLTSQVGTPLQLGGTNAFTQNISGVNTGITLEVNARINPSGMVTLVVNQEVSSPSSGGSSSSSSSGSLTPSFSQQTVQTQVLVHDGDTIAIGGLIGDTTTTGTNGIPLLSRLPYIGALFGSHTYQHERTELILFMTPHVIYDTTDLLQASDELKAKVTKLQRFIKDTE